jgi:type III restriction enzyme
MKLQFKRQQFQTDACNAICDIFTGQSNNERRFLINKGNDASMFSDEGFGNPEIRLNHSKLLTNLREVQKRNNIIPSNKLELLKTKRDAQTLSVPVYTVEMETGTGKTYTYIKTMYELNIRYGFSKFIVIVPSIAIREGVLKSLQITEEHFAKEYGKRCRFFLYASSQLTNLEMFASDAGINIMVINT